MAKQLVVSEEGLKRLQDELEELKTVKRKEIAEKIKEARSFGDLSENSEYDEAKNEQAILEARIADLEAQLKNVRVLNSDEMESGKVNIGNKVKVLRKETQKTEEYIIKGATEADPFNGIISDESPIGGGLLGHGTGDEVEVELPNGSLIHLQILEIGK